MGHMEICGIKVVIVDSYCGDMLNVFFFRFGVGSEVYDVARVFLSASFILLFGSVFVLCITPTIALCIGASLTRCAGLLRTTVVIVVVTATIAPVVCAIVWCASLFLLALFILLVPIVLIVGYELGELIVEVLKLSVRSHG